MTNSKAVREQLLKQAGYAKLPSGKWGPSLKLHNAIGPTCFTCKSCWRRSLQSDLNNLQCPFCGSAMYEGSKP